MFRRFLRGLFLALVRLYYPRRHVLGLEHLPDQTRDPDRVPHPPRSGSGGQSPPAPTRSDAPPVLFVANHPNGLLDPLLLALAVRRPVRFLAKSTFFRNPIGRLAMSCFDAIPVYRATDLPAAGDNRASRNEASFEVSRQALGAGQWLALFPEGTSHSDPQLRPLKTGAARIALGAPGEVRIMPVGLAYESKAIFRSGVQVVIGRALSAEHHRTADPRAAVEALTTEIRQALDAVVLQAETSDLLEGIAQVAAWTAEDAAAAADPAARAERSRRLLEAYRRMREGDPARVEQVVQSARDYARVLQHLGVRDPWALEAPRVSAGQGVRALVKLALTAPFAVVGVLLGWLPYRAAAPVAAQVTQETDVLGTVKLMAGASFVVLTWAAEAVAAGLWLGPPGVLAVVTLAPLGGYAALRFEELAAEWAEARRHLQLRRGDPLLVARLVERRRALAQQIADALQAA